MCRFSTTLMELFQDPANRYRIDDADLVGKGSFDGHPPFVALYLCINGDIVRHASFQAEGCGVTIACGSMLTELIRGRNMSDCHHITARDLAEALDGLPTGKEYCAEVAIRALQDAIRGWTKLELGKERRGESEESLHGSGAVE